MVRCVYLMVLFGFLIGDDLDELEYLQNFHSRFSFKPDSLYRESGLWYKLPEQLLYTGRVEIYLNSNEFNRDVKSTFESAKKDSTLIVDGMNSLQKIAECTIVDGLKNGYYVQYYTHQLKSPGISGLYINDKKEGTWSWFEPYEIKRTKSWYEIDDFIITTIEYYDGVKHGAISVHKTDEKRKHYSNYHYPNDILMLRGQYLEGFREGGWYFFDPILDNVELSSFYFEQKKGDVDSYFWTRKYFYGNNELINKECRDNWDASKDCEDFEQNYFDKLYSADLLDKSYIKVEEEPSGNKVYIKDRMGLEREIDLGQFLAHIGKYHKSKTNIHKQDGFSFDVNDKLRKRLMELNQANK